MNFSIQRSYHAWTASNPRFPFGFKTEERANAQVTRLNRGQRLKRTNGRLSVSHPLVSWTGPVDREGGFGSGPASSLPFNFSPLYKGNGLVFQEDEILGSARFSRLRWRFGAAVCISYNEARLPASMFNQTPSQATAAGLESTHSQVLNYSLQVIWFNDSHRLLSKGNKCVPFIYCLKV